MTWAEKEVPSLELCKRLKELGYPQESSDGGWYWGIRNYQRELLFCNHSQVTLWIKYHQEELGYREIIKAPTCRELGEWLLKVYLKFPTGHPMRNKLISFCLPLKLNPNILSKDLIWLAENGYMKFK